MPWLLAAAALVLCSLGNCVLAAIFPLELEAREGTSWLHVLTLQAHLPLYDHRQVAFLNMNHGPLDPWFKSVVHALLPFLPAALVTRIFCLLLPFGLFLAFFRALERRWLPALVCAAGLHVFLLGLAPFYLLIGRSDPAALFFLALLLAVLAPGRRQDPAAAAPDRLLVRAGAAGVLGAIVFLLNWRFLPYVGAMALGAAIEAGAGETNPTRRGLVALRMLAALLLGFLIPFLAVLLGLFHGDFPLYFSHFFGFFLPDSGWGARQEGPFSLVPDGLRAGKWLAHLLLFALAVWIWRSPGARLSRPRQLALWLPLLLALWVATAWAYFLNRGGGGLYYFAPFYLVLAFHLARSAPRERPAFPAAAGVFLAVLLASLPWPLAWRQIDFLRTDLKPARAFLAQVKALAKDDYVHTEDLYLFKSRYEGEKIDMGDIVFRALETGYYGSAFNATARGYFERLQREPPKFILLADGVRVISPPLNALVARDYVRRLQAPAHLWPNGGGDAVLFQLRSTLPPGENP